MEIGSEDVLANCMDGDVLIRCRKAFERRRVPNLDLKLNEDGSYRYQAARMAFRDFADGWQAAWEEGVFES